MDNKEHLKEIVDIIRSYASSLLRLADVLEEIINTSKEDA